MKIAPFAVLGVCSLLFAASEPGALFPIEEQGRWGYIAADGRTVLKPVYDEAAHFAEGLAPVKIGKLFGYIDPAGAVVIAPRFDEARFFF
jgi:hypothetical protein